MLKKMLLFPNGQTCLFFSASSCLGEQFTYPQLMNSNKRYCVAFFIHDSQEWYSAKLILGKLSGPEPGNA
ncbi:MAG TPA: hypothetical protein VFN95_16595 [Flavitalea sp.]|nr:hypothetical protein [Flavitalea sp.]